MNDKIYVTIPVNKVKLLVEQARNQVAGLLDTSLADWRTASEKAMREPRWIFRPYWTSKWLPTDWQIAQWNKSFFGPGELALTYESWVKAADRLHAWLDDVEDASDLGTEVHMTMEDAERLHRPYFRFSFGVPY